MPPTALLAPLPDCSVLLKQNSRVSLKACAAICKRSLSAGQVKELKKRVKAGESTHSEGKVMANSRSPTIDVTEINNMTSNTTPLEDAMSYELN